MVDTDDRIPGALYVNNKKMRRGHTTGTCAAAASKAAAEAILTQSPVSSVTIHTPKGITLDLPVEDLTFDSAHARCAVRKDGGDDIDATHGALVYSARGSTSPPATRPSTGSPAA